jgi:hypothetical protein
MSEIRRAKRFAERQKHKMMLKVHRQFMDRIKGKSEEEIKQIMEEIKIQYNLKDTVVQDESN